MANACYFRYNTSRIVGGSSGGEGALIASAGSVIGIGSDIGGSIRMPSFFNGIFGHKPSTGIVPNEGQFPCSKGKDREFLVTGPMARFASDLLPVFSLLAGPMWSSKLRLEEPVDPKSIRVLFAEDDGGFPLVSRVDPELGQAQRRLVMQLERLTGRLARFVSVSKLYYSLLMWVAKMSTAGGDTFCALMANGQPNTSQVNPFTELAKWCVGKSLHTLPAIGLGMSEKFASGPGLDVEKLCAMCDALKVEMNELLGDDGVLIYPTNPNIAPVHNVPVSRLFDFAYTGVFNVLGLPVTQVPLGLSRDGLPLGVQIVAGLHQDRLSLALASFIETAGIGGWTPM